MSQQHRLCTFYCADNISIGQAGCRKVHAQKKFPVPCISEHFFYSINMKCFLFLIAMLTCGGMQAQENISPPSVDSRIMRTSKEGSVLFDIRVEAFVEAAPRQVWQTLTDYERLPEFVPNLHSTRRVPHPDGGTVLEQEFTARFLFISQSVHILVRVVEQPHSAIDVILISGNMKHYTAHWQLAPFSRNGIHGTRLIYTGTMAPDFFVPPLVGESIVQKDINHMMDAVVAEIRRRARTGGQ